MIKVNFSHWIEPKEMPFIGHFDSGDADLDREDEQRISEQLAAGNDAAWCVANVEAHISIPPGQGSGFTVTGRDSVGGMSWDSEHQLWKDVLEEMEANALEDLFRQIRSLGERAHRAAVVMDDLLGDSEILRKLEGAR